MENFVIELNAEEEELRGLIEPLLEKEGYELVLIKYRKAHAKALLSLFVDTKDKLSKIELQGLADISRLLSDVLDASDSDLKSLKSAYELEVSSPGLDRPLCKKSHFLESMGQKLKVSLKNIASGKKNFTGNLVGVQDDGILLSTSEFSSPITVHFKDLKDAHLIFQFPVKTKPKKVKTNNLENLK